MPYPTPRPPAPNGPGRCPRCLGEVLWCVTAANRVPFAVDVDRNEAGNQAVRQDVTGRWLTRQLTKDRPTLEHDEHLHMPHLKTCPVPAPRSTPRPARGRTRQGVRPVRWQR
ncbi:hypothetical protein [Streptomyces sp. DH20]|uniref:hypothetical protein n=1 Tax=Streptomyces sp. DH20 TaxID=2857009 RepID=UPI001E5AE6BC|nr:hypothetical protein [Streptomyces sp. DH20]